jgi:hypothetical protein
MEPPISPHLGTETGKLIKIEELKKSPEPECQPEPITSPELNADKKETLFLPHEKSSRLLFQCELCNLSFEHEQDFHVHKWVHEFKTVTGSELLNENFILDSQIQSQGSLYEKLQRNQIKIFGNHEGGMSETPKGKVDVGEKEYFDLPYGWTKEVVTRRNQPNMKGKVRKDIYLISPGNKEKKFRTDNERHSFLGKNPNILCDLEVTSTKIKKHREFDLKEMQKTESMEEQHMKSICPEIKISDQENAAISEGKVPISDLVDMEEVIIDANYTDLTNFIDLNRVIQIDQTADSEIIWKLTDQN